MNATAVKILMVVDIDAMRGCRTEILTPGLHSVMGGWSAAGYMQLVVRLVAASSQPRLSLVR